MSERQLPLPHSHVCAWLQILLIWPGPWLMDRLPSLILDLPHHYALAWWSLDCVTTSARLVTTVRSRLTLLCRAAGPGCSLTLAWSVGQKGRQHAFVPGKEWLRQHFYAGKKYAKLPFLFQKHLTQVVLKIKRTIRFWNKCSISAAEIMDKKINHFGQELVWGQKALSYNMLTNSIHCTHNSQGRCVRWWWLFWNLVTKEGQELR